MANKGGRRTMVLNDYLGVRGYKTLPKKPSTRIIEGRIWVKKAGMYLTYTRLNTEGKSDMEKWESR